MKKFLEDLKIELTKQHLCEKDIEEIIADHEEMIENAIAEGLNEEEMLKRFGNPQALAEELASFSSKSFEPSAIPDDYKFWKSIPLFENKLSIKVSLVYEDIKIYPSSNEDIRVYYKGSADISKYKITCDKNLFIIEAPKYKGFLFTKASHDNLDLIIELPTNILIESLLLNVVSSDVTLQNMDCQSTTLSTTSGDISLTNCKLGETKWNTVSGDIDAIDTKIKNLISSQVTGDIDLKKVYIASDLKLNTVSGDVHLEDVISNESYFHSVSGDLIGNEFYPSSIIFKSVSGDVTIHNKNNTTINVTKSSVSGDINIRSN